jgi:predicted MFS family arabinose efflux permease
VAPVAGFAVAGILGLLAFGFGQLPLVLCAGAILFGIYSGGFFYYLIFHALIHPERSGQYVSVNEAIVGLGSMVGAAAGGWMADRFGFGSPYAIGAVLVALTVLFQRIVKGADPVAYGELKKPKGS